MDFKSTGYKVNLNAKNATTRNLPNYNVCSFNLRHY